jgi:hypothetical protein
MHVKWNNTPFRRKIGHCARVMAMEFVFVRVEVYEIQSSAVVHLQKPSLVRMNLARGRFWNSTGGLVLFSTVRARILLQKLSKKRTAIAIVRLTLCRLDCFRSSNVITHLLTFGSSIVSLPKFSPPFRATTRIREKRFMVVIGNFESTVSIIPAAGVTRVRFLDDKSARQSTLLGCRNHSTFLPLLLLPGSLRPRRKTS